MQRVFVDANIYFSKTLMDWLFHLRQANPRMFQTYSTEDVFAEVLGNMRKARPKANGRLTAQRLKLMKEATGVVLDDFPAGLAFSGTDPHDYHVHAGALAAQAHVILTCNAPQDITTTPDEEDYEVMHPDDFFLLVAQSNPACLKPIVRAQLGYWQTRPEYRQLDDALTRADCYGFAQEVRRTLRAIAIEG